MGGIRLDVARKKTTMNVDERIRFLLRTAIRAEGKGEDRIARLFRRMAEDMSAGESALLPDGSVLVTVAD